jgi:hypothetical protein
MAIDSITRAELNYEWVARYSDGTELHQFDETLDKENLFADIDQSKLAEFSIVKKDGSKTLSVNVKTGLFSLNGSRFTQIEDNGVPMFIGKELPEDVSVRLIYFRRVLRILKINSQEKTLINIFHFLGWQGSVEGKYEKHEIGVSNNTDEIVLPPKETFRLL